ncbi:flagellar assembly protein T N-terminal domain-containing protein [Aquitalea sp. LB_tupeE]|uniref:flagellar assembly protein T N-terminal domain-containing protein n=1 Tax=Aquitalea sp. LB_tupeE TaxID=2748078 RepID=UPI0021060DB7|nr:flagellar assembly protein T N-terminal domain-containing protein [Aquitalea sp. LB_tupeE]
MMTRRVYRLIAALVAAFAFSAPLLAAPIVAEGVADMEAGSPAAREMAIRDALQQAAISNGAELQSLQLVQSGNLSESSVLSAPALQGKVKVLQEYSRDGMYHVRLSIDPQASAAGPVGSAPTPAQNASCGMPAGRTLRRKLLTTYFYVVNPSEANDLRNLATALPTDLARRLRQQSQFEVRNAGHLTVLSNMAADEPMAGWDTVRELGRREDVQFVVAGRVLSTGVVAKGVQHSMFESNKTSQQGAYYTGPLAGMFGQAFKYAPTARQFDLEVWVYDALTGAVLADQRVSQVARGKVVPQLPVDFATAAFWEGDYGRVVDALLDQTTRQLGEVLSCIPLSAKVVKVEDGRQVFINAGGLDGMKVGDQMLLYKPRSAQIVRSGGGVRELGVPEDLSGTITLTQVQPNFSIAQVQSARLKVEEGDYVRFMTRR